MYWRLIAMIMIVLSLSRIKAEEYSASQYENDLSLRVVYNGDDTIACCEHLDYDLYIINNSSTRIYPIAAIPHWRYHNCLCPEIFLVAERQMDKNKWKQTSRDGINSCACIRDGYTDPIIYLQPLDSICLNDLWGLPGHAMSSRIRGNYRIHFNLFYSHDIAKSRDLSLNLHDSIIDIAASIPDFELISDTFSVVKSDYGIRLYAIPAGPIKSGVIMKVSDFISAFLVNQSNHPVDVYSPIYSPSRIQFWRSPDYGDARTRIIHTVDQADKGIMLTLNPGERIPLQIDKYWPTHCKNEWEFNIPEDFLFRVIYHSPFEGGCSLGSNVIRFAIEDTTTKKKMPGISISRYEVERDLKLHARLLDDSIILFRDCLDLNIFLVNESETQAYHVLAPGKGSYDGRTDPYIYYIAEHLDSDGIWRKLTKGLMAVSYFTDWGLRGRIRKLNAGDSLELKGSYMSPSSYLDFDRPGKYRLTAHYEVGHSSKYIPKKWRIRRSGKEPEFSRMPEYEIVAETIEFEIKPRPLQFYIYGKNDLKAGDTARLSEIVGAYLINTSDKQIEALSPSKNGYVFYFYSKDRFKLMPAFDTDDSSRVSLVLNPGERVPVLGNDYFADGVDYYIVSDKPGLIRLNSWYGEPSDGMPSIRGNSILIRVVE